MSNLQQPPETWKAIKGYEGLYEISNLGRVKSLQRTYQVRWVTMNVKEKIIAHRMGNTGYLRVELNKKCKGKKFSVHRLVGVAFHPIENSEKYDINHINGIKTDNRAVNLEWVTPSDNQKHAYLKGLQARQIGIKSSSAKLDNQKVKEIRSLFDQGNVLQKDIASQYGISISQVSDIINKKRSGWQHVN